MAVFTVYEFTDEDGAKYTFTTQNYEEAQRYAQRNALRITGHEYEWSRAIALEDFTHLPERSCPECSGVGRVSILTDWGSWRGEDCDRCNGTGTIPNK